MNRDQAAQLAIAVTNYRNTIAIQEAETARALKMRNDAIVNALNAGMLQKDVAREVGVGREQIRLIAKRAREDAA